MSLWHTLRELGLNVVAFYIGLAMLRVSDRLMDRWWGRPRRPLASDNLIGRVSGDSGDRPTSL